MRGEGYSADPCVYVASSLGPREAAGLTCWARSKAGSSVPEVVLQCVALPQGCSELGELLGTSGNSRGFRFCFKYKLIFSDYERNACSLQNCRQGHREKLF